MSNPDQRVQQLHSRAERASSDAQKAMLSLSTGGVGLFSALLTQQAQPHLSMLDRYMAVASAASFGACVLTSIFRMKTDAQRFYYMAKAEAEPQRTIRRSEARMASARHKANRIAANLQPILFLIGVFFATFYTVSRAFILHA